MTKVVCALSGGGAKTAAHRGAVRALRETGLVPAHYVGTSMGAIIAAVLAAGCSLEEARRLLSDLRLRDLAAPAPSALLGYFSRGLFRPGPFRRAVARLVPARRFADLEVALTITAVDTETGELALFGTGGRDDVPLVDALYAACALPVYYPPAEIDGRRYVDGGVRAVLPLDTAARFAPDVVFAVDVGPSWRELPADGTTRVPPLVRQSGQVQRILMAAYAEEMLGRWAARPVNADPELILVQPPVRAETTFRLDLVGAYEADGYRTAAQVLAERGARRDMP
ncbi:MAG: patatin-like phospholipase family protein [Gemmatimonadota bacterium]|nr:patatin-like phospholipase family protein [Gemmatimonadota bacterium]